MDLEEIRALDGHLDRQHPIRQAAQPVQLDGATDDLGEDRQPLLGAGGTGVAGRQQGQIGLGLTIEGGGDVDIGLVIQ